MTNRRTILKASAFATGGWCCPAPSAPGPVREFRMVEAGGLSGDSIEAGYIRPFTALTGIRVGRENPTRSASCAPWWNRAPSPRRCSSSAACPPRSRRRRADRTLDWAGPIRADVRGSQAALRLSAPVLFHHHGLAVGCEAADELGGFLECPRLPRQAHPAGQRDARGADRAARRWRRAAQLYPLDLRRAFRSSIRSRATSRCGGGRARSRRSSEGHEVQYAASYSGRVAGQPGITITYAQGLLDLAYFVVPKGVNPPRRPRPWACCTRCRWRATRPRGRDRAYTGPSPSLDPLLPQARRRIPTTAANKAMQPSAIRAGGRMNRDAANGAGRIQARL